MRLVKMASLRSTTEVFWLTRNSHSSPIMVLTVTVMNIVMAAPIQYTVQKNRSISIFMKMDFLVFLLLFLTQVFVANKLAKTGSLGDPALI